MNENAITKALEVWTLQSLLNVSIICGILATGLALMQDYWRALEKRLSLRVSIEIWQVFTVMIVDFLLVVAVVIGYMLLNSDIMADVKMAVPFGPVATILFAAAVVLRLFYGGHDAASPNHARALYLMLAANLVNVVGFTFVIEAASDEYLAIHPSAAWEYIKTHFRSNVSPHGLELAQITFWICFPILAAVCLWGIAVAIRKLAAGKDK
jgi:hypothetical protein